MGRFGSIDEFAATAAYLASDDAGFVTASSFPLSGGIAEAYTIPTGLHVKAWPPPPVGQRPYRPGPCRRAFDLRTLPQRAQALRPCRPQAIQLMTPSPFSLADMIFIGSTHYESHHSCA